jgi:hypothetical protein
VDVEQSLPILDLFFAKALDAYSYTTSSSAAIRSSLVFQLIYVGANHMIPKKLLDGVATQLDSDFQSFMYVRFRTVFFVFSRFRLVLLTLSLAPHIIVQYSDCKNKPQRYSRRDKEEVTKTSRNRTDMKVWEFEYSFVAQPSKSFFATKPPSLGGASGKPTETIPTRAYASPCQSERRRGF